MLRTDWADGGWSLAMQASVPRTNVPVEATRWAATDHGPSAHAEALVTYQAVNAMRVNGFRRVKLHGLRSLTINVYMALLYAWTTGEGLSTIENYYGRENICRPIAGHREQEGFPPGSNFAKVFCCCRSSDFSCWCWSWQGAMASRS